MSKPAIDQGRNRERGETGPGKHRGIAGFFWRLRLMQLDFAWHWKFGNCFEMFPPSFYYLHTEEEIERIIEEQEKEYDRLLEKLREKKS